MNMWYVLLIPLIFAYDCEQICHIKLTALENTPVANLQWNLRDLLSNRTASYKYFQYSLANPSEYFELNSTIFKFRLKELDREKICKNHFLTDECALDIQFFTQTSFIILLKFIILDVNDWKPTFNQDSIALTIRENLPIDHRVQLPIAYDYDSMKYNIDHYEFVENVEEIFQLEESYEELRLRLLKKLDCERRNNYQLSIIAVDKGGWKSNLLHVNVTVGDLNEYQPRFTQRFYHTRIPENLSIVNSSSASILQIIAIDDDCYDKIIHYSIVNNEIPAARFPFIIDKYTGYIRVRQLLDYETISTYRFRVKASNLDQITSSIVPIIIDVLDINDNPPLIYLNILNEYKSNENDENCNVTINENIRLGQVIGTVLIRDSDSAMINRRLSLKILSCLPLTMSCPIELDSRMGNNSFHPTTYLIRISRMLNSEAGDQKFVLIFEARDYGDPSLSSQYRLLVNINDVNDCAPKFTQDNYPFRVSNSSPIGFLLGQVHAIDDDYSSNYHHIQYQFLDDHHQDVISIDSNNGNLFLIKQPSISTVFNLTVMAIDEQDRSLNDRTNVEILVYDEITCSAAFDQTVYVFNTTEHERTPYEIGQVNVNDCLASSIPVSYHLIKPDSSPFPFSIDTKTGRIIVLEELDREMKSSYKFSIYSFNHETEHSDHVDIQIHILDKNDHHPIFDDPHEQYLSISTHHPQTFIANIHATDADSGLNGQIDYYFTNIDHYAYFHLYSNGSLILYNALHIYLPIRLEIYARDQGYPEPLSSKEKMIIHLCDIFKRNECASNTIREDLYLGSILIIISMVVFFVIIISCIFWNLFLQEHRRLKCVMV